MRRFNKLEEAVLKMVKKSNINPSPITNQTGDNTPDTINMWALRKGIMLYINDVESYGTEEQLTEATEVLMDFIQFVEAMGVSVDDEQDIIDYNVIDNVIEEESEMDNYNEMRDEQ